jgi:predicted nucleotidyltransferase
MSQREALTIVGQYVRLLNDSGFSIYKAFVYGSYATDQATSESDIDVLLVSKVFDEPGIAAQTKVWALTRQVDTRIEPYGIGIMKFLSDDASPLLAIVKLEGIEIPEFQS